MVHTFERGKASHYSHASLHGEVMQVRQTLLDWGVRPACAWVFMPPTRWLG